MTLVFVGDYRGMIEEKHYYQVRKVEEPDGEVDIWVPQSGFCLNGEDGERDVSERLLVVAFPEVDIGNLMT